MALSLTLTARVQAGHKLEIVAPELTEGDEVSVFVTRKERHAPQTQTLLEFLDSLPPGPRSDLERTGRRAARGSRLMGSLTLPPDGVIYVETPVIINHAVEPHSQYAPLLRPLWQSVQVGSIQVVTSELTLLETLVHPIRNRDTSLQAAYERLLLSTAGVALLPLTRDVLREAARLRAAIPGLRTPDALHAATALGAGCTLFLTNDSGFRRVPGLSLTLLDDVMTA